MICTKILRNTVMASFAALLLLSVAPTAQAQEDTILPKLPTPIQNLVSQGAQVRFLGKEFGVNGWVAIKNGQEQYFYVLADGKSFISGILFDEKGQAVTIDQVNRLRGQSGDLLDTLTTDAPLRDARKESVQADKYEFKTPSEQLYSDVENSNWVPIGEAGTPLFYSFIDPQCPHCHAMMKEIKGYIDAGKAQIRLIPVGLKEETRAQAAFLLATPAPDKAWWRHINGDTTALPAKQEINKQGVERNMAVMQSWKLSATPLIVYRGKDNKIKIIRGKPKDLKAFIDDLGSRS